MKGKSYCTTSYLVFRYVVDKYAKWSDKIAPVYPDISPSNQICVNDCNDVNKALKKYALKNIDDETGILLSGGIDSAIIASFLPEGANAYTIRFIAEDAIDESSMAKIYAERYNLNLNIIDVSWKDYERFEPLLMKNKNSPLHPVEVGLYVAAEKAAKANDKKLLLGNGADSTFGGMDKLLSKNWKFDDFVKRYSYTDPTEIIKKTESVIGEYERYRIDCESIDYVRFLKETHGIGIIQAFNNAIESAGCVSLEPFETMYLGSKLDIPRIRAGEPKYILAELFRNLYPGIEPPRKIPFARPMDTWLKDWGGPKREEFIPDCDRNLTGDQKYLVYCLERFLNIMQV